MIAGLGGVGGQLLWSIGGLLGGLHGDVGTTGVQHSRGALIGRGAGLLQGAW